MRPRIRIAGVVMILIAAGCQYTPERFLAFQNKRYGYLAELYPPGVPRDELRSRFGGGTYEISNRRSLTDQGTYDIHGSGDFARLMSDAAVLRTGRRPVSADRFLYFESYYVMSWTVDLHYVLYDEQDRVVTAFGVHQD